MAKFGIERSIKGAFSVIKRTFKATRLNYVNTYLISLTHGRSKPLKVVILLHLTLKRGPIFIQHDFLQLMDNWTCRAIIVLAHKPLVKVVVR